LNKRPPDRDHRLFDALIAHHLAMDRLHPVAIEVPGDGGIEVLDRNPDMIEVVELHLPKLEHSGAENPRPGVGLTRQNG
jgi:hypothetical protein